MEFKDFYENIIHVGDIKIKDGLYIRPINFIGNGTKIPGMPMADITVEPVDYPESPKEKLRIFSDIVDFLNKQEKIRDIRLNIEGHSDTINFTETKCNWINLTGTVTFKMLY